MGENDESRRRDDVLLGELLGAFKEYKEQSVQWRKESDSKFTEFEKTLDGRIKPLEDFIDELRTPRTAFVWLFRAVGLALGVTITGFVTNYIKNHIK